MDPSKGIADDVVEKIVLEWKNSGNAQLKNCRHLEAFDSYTTGIGLASAGHLRGQLYSNRAQVCLLLGRYDDAISDADLAVEDDESNAKAYWRGGTAAMQIQKYEVAKRFCERGLTKAGKNSALEQLLLQVEKQCAKHSPKPMPIPDCAICLRPYDEQTDKVTLSCKHSFHKECVFELKSHGATQLCPLCRVISSRVDQKTQLIDDALMFYIRSTAGQPSNMPSDGVAAAEAASRFRQILKDDPETPVAARALGCLYDVGAGVPKDIQKAVDLWQSAAAMGDAGAQYLLGVKYDTGNHVQADEVKTLELWEKASAEDHPSAQLSLALKYDQGDSKSKAKAVELLERAAALGHPGAQFNLGVKLDGGDCVRKDRQRSLELWQRAAAQGHAGAQFNLGARYNRGDGLQQDKAKAAKYWELAAKQGHPAAQYNLGIKYYSGDGVEEDFDKAEELWEMAAKQGHKDAMHNLKMLRGGEDEEDNEQGSRTD